MKNIILVFGMLSLVQCQSQEKKEKEIKMETYSETYQTPLPNLQRRVYGIGLNIPGPYELYINDIAARKEYSPAMHNAAIEINPYVLKSGKYKFKLRVFPMPSELEKGGIQPHTAKDITITLETFEKVKEGEGAQPQTFKVLQEYAVPVISQPVPFLDIEGEFEVELPYELEGWSQGQDLSKIDSTRLKEKVVKYYEKLWNILNEGDFEKWKIATQQRQQETYIFNYTSENLKNETQQENEKYILKCKGMMAPLEDYKMYIYGQGKLVTLEREHHTQEMNNRKLDAKGESPLMRKGKISGVAYYSGILYLPQGSDEFVIIRK